MVEFFNSISEFFDLIYTAISTVINGLITMIKAVFMMAGFVTNITYLIPTMCLAFIVLGISVRILYKIIGR